MKVSFYLNASATDDTDPEETHTCIKANYEKIEDLPYQPQIGWKKKLAEKETGTVQSVTMNFDGTLDVQICADNTLSLGSCEILRRTGWKESKRK